MTAPTLTVAQVLALRPCSDYPRARVKSLCAGRVALTAADVATLEIPPKDRLWCLLRMAPREVWLPAIYAAAERAIRAASRALYDAGHVEESARLEHLPPIVDAASASAAESAAWAAGDAAWAARAAAWAASAAESAAESAASAARAAARTASGASAAESAAARAADLETTVAHVARLIGQHGGER